MSPWKAFVSYSQNLPLPLRLWTSIKPFITPRSNFSIFPTPCAYTTSVDPEHRVKSVFCAPARTSEVVIFQLNGSLSALHISFYQFLFFYPLAADNMDASFNWCLWSNSTSYLLIFSSCPNHPRDKNPRNRPGTHRSAEMRGNRRPRSDIWVVQGREKVRPLGH